MLKLKLKTFIGFALAFFLLLAPLFLLLSSNEMTHAQPPGTPPGQGGTPPGKGGTPPGQGIPEPATWILVGSGGAGLVWLRKKLKK
jgi:hypothetical protein